MFVSINTGSDAVIAGAEKITNSDLGVRYSGFRSIDRFLDQIKDMHVGLISWPGGTLAEERLGSFGLEYDDLTSADSRMPSLSQMMQVANEQGAELSIVLPTARYSGRIDEMRADVQNFMQDLLSGQYGELPERLIFHIGSEHYHHFQGLSPDGAAAEYGRVASAMVEELTDALNDPSVNQIRADIDLSVQAGRTMAEDEDIRDSFSPEALANVDLVMHHRYAARAEGIDFNLKSFSPILDAWQQDVTQAGGDAPQIHLSEWNVASVTRTEGLNSYIREMASQGITVQRGDVDLAGRTTTEFENFWQDLLATRDYGVAVPKLYLEMFSEYQAEGLGAASIHAADLMHAGRMTYTDTEGNPVQFVGAEMMKMIYESVEGTQVLDVSTENTRSSDVWTYAYEGDDRLVVFLAADSKAMPGKVTVDIEGLSGGYTAIWTDSLTAQVPDDWMERFGVPDNPNVDESNEGQTYALGVRGDVPTTINGDQVSVTFSHPGQVVRIVIAQTQAEADRIEEWAGEPDFAMEGSREIIPVTDTASSGLQNGFLPPSYLNDTANGDDRIDTPSASAEGPTSAFSNIWSGNPPFISRFLLSLKGEPMGPPAGEFSAFLHVSDGAQNNTGPTSLPASPTVSAPNVSTVPGTATAMPQAPLAQPPSQPAQNAGDGFHYYPETDSAMPNAPLPQPTGHSTTSGGEDHHLALQTDTTIEDDFSSLLSGPPAEQDEPDDAMEDSPDRSAISEIATMAGSTFGAALMGILASLAQLAG